jgi:hypothetical protein
VELTFASPLPPGRFQLVFSESARTRRCDAVVGEGGGWASTPCDFVLFGGTPNGSHGLSATYLGTPATLGIELVRGGRRVASTRLSPDYETVRPNGKMCPPTCRRARAVLAVQP